VDSKKFSGGSDPGPPYQWDGELRDGVGWEGEGTGR
jgi:hypothetical protein